MPRSTVQNIAERLHKEGILNFYIMRRYKYWVAEEPAQLLKRLKHREELIASAIPKLAAIRKKARTKLRNEKHLNDLAPLVHFANGMRQPVLIADTEAEIRYVNKAWEDLFGYTCEEMIGRNTSVLKSNKTPEVEYARLWKSLNSGGLFSSDSIINLNKDGAYVFHFTIIFPVLHGNRTFYIQILESKVGEINTQKDKRIFYETIKEQ
jgi:PAS domain S-box-containing protein